jgi:hypothetical protein
MQQPCVKFLSHTVTYLAFIIMIIVSSVQFSEEQKNMMKFSKLVDSKYDNYTNYFIRNDLKYKFEAGDFYIRRDDPSELDIAITIWIIGENYSFLSNSCMILFLFIKSYSLIISIENLLNNFN